MGASNPSADGDGLAATLGVTVREPRFEGAFDAVECPVCGHGAWGLIPAEGVFCDECNCKAELRPTNGDPGFVVDFHAGHCWAEQTGGVPEERLIPKGDRGHYAYAKFMGRDGEYFRAYLAVPAIEWEDGAEDHPQKDWTPAWDAPEGDRFGPDPEVSD